MKPLVAYVKELLSALLYMIIHFRSLWADYFASCAQARRWDGEYLCQYPEDSFTHDRGNVAFAIANFYEALRNALMENQFGLTERKH